MASCASRIALLGLLVAAAGARAQEPGAAPPGVAARVDSAVAARWGVAPDRVRLEWGPRVFPAVVGESTAVRLLGRGDGGWFAVWFDTPGHPRLAARVRAGTLDTMAVAAHPLAMGAVLSDSDIALTTRVRWGPPEAGGSRPAAGWLLHWPVAAGSPLDPPVATAPPLVAAGARVRLFYANRTVTLALEGVALQDGRLGQRILVRPDGGARSLWGTVDGPGVVRLAS